MWRWHFENRTSLALAAYLACGVVLGKFLELALLAWTDINLLYARYCLVGVMLVSFLVGVWRIARRIRW